MSDDGMDIKELSRKRGTCKGRLTTFEKHVNSFSADHLCDEAQSIELKMRIDRMNENFDEFTRIQGLIEQLTEEGAELKSHESYRDEFETLFFRCMARAQTLYNTYKIPKGASSSSSSEQGDGSTVKRAHRATRSVKLPTIQIPKFSGDYKNWLEFRDTFISLVHNSSDISNIQKFHYLRASLDGSAGQIIRSIEFSANNYTIAWNLLCQRFDNTRILIQNHLKAIFNEEPVKKESADSLRRIIDSYSKNLRSLELLGEPVTSWDTLIIYIISSKLDARTLREWEEHKPIHKTITLKIFTEFLKNRADLLETIELSNNNINKTQVVQPFTNKPNKNIRALTAATQSASAQNKTYPCPLCNENHALYKCDKFLQMSLDERGNFVYSKKLCANCFRSGHNKRACRLGPCQTCKRKHNTLLHKDSTETPASPNTTALSVSSNCGQALLATALVKIKDNNNQWHEVRAVLDSGSQASFMTESLLSKLSLKPQEINFSVAGINNVVSPITKKCETIIQSRLNSYQTNVKFLVLPSITSPSSSIIDVSALNIPSTIVLADPTFYNPSTLDLLLGADIFWDLLGTNQIRVNKNHPVLQETKLGYIVSGPTGNSRNKYVSCNFGQFDEIQEQLSKFWSIEEIPDSNKQAYSIEENLCEEHFIQNMSREKDGRFSVAIPLKMPETALGDSYQKAEQCFLSLERRLKRQRVLKDMYVSFMKEYSDLGHMTKSDIKNPAKNSYFLPHHGVLREQSTTTKLRAVFNASAATTTGLSLNEIQMVGPTIQSDLFSILLRFRQHRYVLVGDIEKMYRQVLINKNQRHLQQIIWRDSPSKPLETYTLNTVTYGTASAPFLAVRCLKYLADECDDPRIRQIINEDFYVDDLLTGDATVEGLMQIKSVVCKVLASGCFNLRKFKSNLPICNNQGPSDQAPVVHLNEYDQSSALGLKWNPPDDKLLFVINDSQPEKITKRVILSTISQVFDPLGLLSLFIIVGKILLQRMWLHKLQWDDPLPQEVLRLWTKFQANLIRLNSIRIPRCVVCDNPTNIQLHAFSDASKDAYGGCIYVRSEDEDGNVEVHLLCAKSKVAPIKANTIPRLELCGAAAAAKLLVKVLKTTRLVIARCVLWTDSSVVLSWLKTPPNKLKQFVKNRVAAVQEMTHNHSWRHVPTTCNPADLLSRGVTATDNDKLNLWWNGPQFLLNSEDCWPNKTFDTLESDLPEIIAHAVFSKEDKELFPFSRFSKFIKINNVMAYVLRFISNCRNRTNSLTGSISCTERKTAYNKLLQLSQMETFTFEYTLLMNGKQLPTKNKLLSLSPFMDENALLRVGGRIKNGNYDFSKKHPILLSSKHSLTKLIFTHEHLRLMHAGPQLLLCSIREHLWPIGGRNLAKQVFHKCLRCFRMNARTVTPIMGNLPEQRLHPGYPFQTTGMDYAGPITALNRKGRGSQTIKVYIAIFVCFTTKSIHLELVSDLTKDAFLSTLRRFISRRSKPQCLVSDNGTQFVGAKNELTKFFKDNAVTIGDTMSQEGIDFKFIPAYTPHMAGLAEAGVKSVKMHLRRVLGDAHLVFEDLYTTIVQIEAILNSRPLTAMTNDPHDMTPLTPGHFLVGRPLSALPTPPLVDMNQNRLTRFERLEQMRQQFWARWHKEYISEMQLRTKWRSSTGNIKEGTLVLIKEDSLPPMKWCLGRVYKTYPGSDGVTRVADLKTAKGIIRRAFNKICPLPVEDSVEREAFQRRGIC